MPADPVEAGPGVAAGTVWLLALAAELAGIAPAADVVQWAARIGAGDAEPRERWEAVCAAVAALPDAAPPERSPARGGLVTEGGPPARVAAADERVDPLATPTSSAASSPTIVPEPPAEQAEPADIQWATLRATWPRLAAEDRLFVVMLASRLADARRG